MPRSPRLLRWMLLLVMPASCANDCGYGIDIVRPELFAETEAGTVYDAGAFPIGMPSVVYLTLTAATVDVAVQDVDIVSVGSAQAFYTLQEWQELAGSLPEGIENADAVLDARPVIVSPQTVGFEYPFVYFSPDEAWSQAEIRFDVDGRYGAATQRIRAHAAAPSYAVFPPVVDFGHVPAGGVGAAEVQIRNDGDVPLVVSLRDSPDEVATTEPEALVVAPGETHAYALELHPRSEDPFAGTLTLVSGTAPGAATLGVIDLRANDCAHALPAAHDRDFDGFTSCAGDCDDAHAEAHPGAPEVLDGLDDDCDGVVDDHLPGSDDDGDGWCEHASGCLDFVSLPGDCDDGDTTMHPGAAARPGVDADCDGAIDDGAADADGDGWAPGAGDCDDADPTVFPGAPEGFDGADDDCDTHVDEGTEGADDDGDHTTELDGDCDDASPDVHPGAVEVANLRDDDCDGRIDDGTEHADDDGDGLAEVQGDCDDGDDHVAPGAREAANGRDDDCDGRIDEDLDDVDHDGVTVAEGDCDDENGWAHPGAEEVFDGIDNDCGGHVDDVPGEMFLPPDPRPTGCATGALPSPTAALLLALVAVRRRRRGSPPAHEPRRPEVERPRR